MASGPDQNNELNMLDVGSYSEGLTVQLDYGYFDCSVATWIMHSFTLQKHRAAITILTLFCIKLKYYFSVIIQRGSSNVA